MSPDWRWRGQKSKRALRAECRTGLAMCFLGVVTVRLVTVMALASAVGLVLLSLTPLGRTWLRLGGSENDLIPLPTPSVAAVAEEPTSADFVGAAVCGECHVPQYDVWRRSTHARAGGSADASRVLAPFDGRPIRFRDAMVTPRRTAGGDFVFIVDREGWPQVTLRVDGVVGGGHLAGGGTQAFFSRYPDGSVRYLPFDYHPGEAVWFCDASPAAGGEWVPITEALALGDCRDWPPSRVLGTGGGVVSCQECHGSQIASRLVGGDVPYETRWSSLAINCESCHGPGREHVTLARSGRLAESADIEIAVLDTLSTDASLGVCFRCHALKKELGRAGYLPGKAFAEYYATLYSQLGDQPYFPDGRIRTFAYQGNHLASDCYLSGSLTCVDCHDPHAQGYRDVHRRPLEGRFSNGQCLGCHASKAEGSEAHTHHAVDSPGGVCVSCHMPYLQHPAIGSRLRFARSDHTIPIPRPAFDDSLGIESACTTCHQDQTVAQLDAQVSAWYGALKPLADPVQRLLQADDTMERGQAAELLLYPAVRHPMAQFAGLARFVERHLEPDMPAVERDVERRLIELARSDDVDVQSLALAALHLARGRDPRMREFLAERLEGSGALEGPIRRRWVLALGYLGDAYRRSAEIERAIATYGKAQEILPNDPRVLGAAALAFTAAGSLVQGIALLERTLEVDSLQPLALADLGALRAATGDTAGAFAALERALRINPWESTAQLNLGHLSLASGRLEDAAAAYGRATETNPALVAAHVSLADVYLRLGRPEDAAASARRALQLAPANARAQQLLEEAEQARGASPR